MIFIVSSPSGAGKTTLCKSLFAKFPEIGRSISVTTRKIREKEIEGVDYYFRTESEFKTMIADGKFLEYVEFCGNFYGTLKSEITKSQNNDENAIMFDIEWQGARQIKSHQFDVVSVFILPPSMEILESRLKMRKTEDKNSLEARLANAKNEILHAGEYDYIIINDNLAKAQEDICAIFQAESLKRMRKDYLAQKY